METGFEKERSNQAGGKERGVYSIGTSGLNHTFLTRRDAVIMQQTDEGGEYSVCILCETYLF